MKALVGSWDYRSYRFLAEITALRSRVADLEHEVARLRAENAALREAADDEADVEVALSRG